MKAKVIRRFRDKDTNETYESPRLYSGDQKRVKYLQQLGYLGEQETESDSRLEGNVQDVKNALDGLDQESLTSILVEEKANKNRKGVIDHIESLLIQLPGEEGE